MSSAQNHHHFPRRPCALLASAILLILAHSSTRAQMIQINGQGGDDIVENANPEGFQLQKEDLKAIGKLEDFDRYVSKKAWELAFRTMNDFSDSETQGMVPASDGFYVPMRRRIAMSLKNLPADGRDAYRLFYDADARQLWSKVQSGKISTTEESQTLQKIVTRYFLTSVGDVAADRLGDLYFEQGDFGNAEGAWAQIIRDFPDSRLSLAKLQVKRCLALARQDRRDELAALAAQVKERYAGQTITLGGQDFDAAAFVDSLTAASPATQHAAPESTALKEFSFPTRDDPLWRVKAVLPETLEQMDQQLRNSGWGTQYLQFNGIIPTAAADDKRVYINWLGVVYAVDLESGKMLWRTGKFTDVSAQPMNFVQNGVDPQRFAISLTDGKIFALVGDPRNNGNDIPYQVECLDANTGNLLWKGDRLGSNVALLTLPYMIGDQAYAAGTMRDDTMYLMSFDLHNGKLEWKIPIGKPQGNQNYRGQRDLGTPALQAIEGMMFVSTNNGALVAVNTAQRHVEWAFRCDTRPVNSYGRFSGYESLPAFASPATLLLHDGTLYLKDTGGTVLYALDPMGPSLKWKREGIKPESTLFAVEGQRGYLFGKELAAMNLKDPTPWLWDIDLKITRGGLVPLITPKFAYVSTSRGIYQIPKNRLGGDPINILRLGDHEALEGRLIVAGDKLINVTDQAISAYALDQSAAAK